MSRPLVVVQAGAFPFPLPQGSQVHVRGMSAALARAGHRVIVACWADGEGEVPGVVVRRTARMPGSVRRSGPHWTRGPQDVALAGLIRRILAEERVDVVHAHNVEAPVAAWLGRFGRKVPIVYERHTRMGEELPTYVRRGRRVARVVGRVVDRLVPALCDATVALSDAGPGAFLIPPAIDPADLDGADAQRARERWDLGDGPWVAYAGNTDPYQDLPVWFEAMAQVPEAGLLMVTADDTDDWELRARALGIARFRFVRTSSFADVKDALAAAAIAVSPRTKCAGFPIKLLNHAGLGVPTVAARGSAREGLGVVAVADGDPGAMAEAIRSLLADPARRRALGEAGRNELLRAWTWDARVPELERLYRSLGASR